MKKYCILLCTMYLLPLLSIGQSDELIYTEVNELDNAYKIALTPEEDIILLGKHKMVKLNSNGLLLWESTISVSSASIMNDFIIAPDGNIFVSANIKSDNGDFGSSAYPGIIKFNAQGDSLWFKSPFINDTDINDSLTFAQFNSIIQTSNGSLALTGFATDTAGNQPLLVTKMSTEGETEWLFSDTLYYSICHYEGNDIIEATDGNIYITGISELTAPSIWGWYGAMLTKFNANGNLLINKRFPEGGLTTTVRAWSLLETQNKIVLHTTDYEEENPYLSIFRQTDLDGNMLNLRYFGSELTEFNLSGMLGYGTQKLKNEGFLHFGSSIMQSKNQHFGIISKFNSNLVPQWVYAIGDSTSQNTSTEIIDAAEFENGNLIFLGHASSGVFIAITDSNGNGNYPGHLILNNKTPSLKTLAIYPNPTENSITISLENKKEHNYRITSIDGRILQSGTIKGVTKLDISHLSGGIVLFSMDGYKTRKVVIQ